MRVHVHVFSNSRRPGIDKQPDGSLWVRVNAQAREGKANEEVIEALAGHFSVPKSHIRILHGEAYRDKLVEVIES